MWLIAPPCASCHSAPEEAGSISESSWQCRALASSAGWNGMPAPASTWRLRLRRVESLRSLSGLTCDPSTLARGVESWISSLRDTRASRSASRGGARAPKILGISGLTSPESRGSAEQGWFLWKTSPAIFASDSARSPESYERWATGLRREYSRRLRLARRIDESGCSRSQWQTPIASNGRWRSRRVAGTGCLEPMLPVQARQWPTPTASEGAKCPGPRRAGDRSLSTTASMWATPTARDHKDAAEPTANVPTSFLLGRQAPRIMRTGLAFCAPDRSLRRRLNPLFVTWLMGWPTRLDSESSETAWCRWWRLMRSELSSLRSCGMKEADHDDR